MDGYTRYRFTGVNRAHQTVHGSLVAKNKTLAKIELFKQHIHVKKIIRDNKKIARISYQTITRFTRSLSALLKAHLPLVQALELLEHSEANPRMRSVLKNLQHDVQTGIPLAHACRKHPRYFTALFCHIVYVGERSGSLTRLLNQLASHREAEGRMKKKIRAAMTYPLAILSVACCVTLGLLLFVVPQFQTLFASFDAALPKATLSLIWLASALKNYGLMLFVVILISAYGCRYLHVRTDKIAYMCDDLKLRVPLLGHITRLAMLTRITQTLSILLSAGLPLVDAIGVCANLAANRRYTQSLLTIQTQLTEGYPLQRAFEETGLYPAMMTQLIGMGEASGRLESMLEHVAEQQRDALHHAMQTLSSLFEPCLMALLGLWVGGLIVALYLPIFQLGGLVS
jgi:type IV pilus assembly protein PilC